MKSLLVSLIAVLLLSAQSGVAEETAEGPEMLGFYHFYAPDPGAVVAAMDKFWASDCGKEYPAEVALAAEVFNGGYASSHFVLNTFPNAAAQEQAASILMSCPDGRVFLEDLQSAYLNHFEIPAIVLSLLPRPQFAIALIEEGYEEINFQDEPYVVGPDIHQLAGIHRSKINQMTLVEA